MAIIKIKRGLKANIPALEVGEPGFCTDTKELFVGSPDGNKLVGEGTFLKLSGGTLTGALTLPVAPIHPYHVANKAYVDNVALGLDVKASVKCVATVNQSFSEETSYYEYEYVDPNPVIIDGYTLEEGDRILLVGQSDPIQNGIFVVGKVGDSSTPCMIGRPDDAREGTLTGGAFAFVEKGNAYAGSGWVCTSHDDPFIIGSTIIRFTQFTGAGSASFVALSDTPSSYNSQGGKLVRVNTGEVGLEFIDPSTVGRTTFLQLDDTPSAYQNDRLLVSGVDSINFVAAKVFSGLFADVPNDISANGKTLVSNDGLMVLRDFKTTGLLDMPATMGDEQQILRVNAARTALEYFTPEESPVSGSKAPIAAGWAFTHNAESVGIHGAPFGKSLLHEDSVIDGGAF